MRFGALIAAFLAAGSAFAAEPHQDRVVLPKTAVPIHYRLDIAPDAQAKTFRGTVAITLKVVTPTKDIVLNAADLAFRSVSLSGRSEKPAVAFNEEQQTATLHYPTDIAPGEYTLSIAYDGKIFDSPAGLFALDYAGVDGKKRALFTQFENSDARRFLPSWDEPGIKATYTLSVTLPANEMPVSNMPVEAEKPLPGGQKTVLFKTTPKMSSYLLFYGQGDFERISRKVDGVDVGVIFKRGDGAKATFALEAACEILPFYNSYFGTPYPLPKLDMIAGPGQSQFFGAMENWGAIFYFEKTLLFDPKTSDEGDRRGAFITIAHEMAHQWFGDLVTMAWWDDLWLNEGFASWMEYKAADKLHPDWNIWLQGTRSKEYAMGSDARRGTHPIIQPITDVLQASQAFDEITYTKGAAVIRMLEDHLGEAAFRAGVRSYMQKYAYGNTVTNDLWTELEKASGQPVTEIAHGFTLQPGVPLISVTRNKSGITLTQSRFAVDDSGKEKLTWHVPVTVSAVDGKVLWRGIVGAEPVEVSLPKGSVAVVNAGQAGYYRTLYDSKLFAALAERFAGLSPYDQLGLLSDTNALGRNGNAPVTDILVLLGKASPAMEGDVQQAIASQTGGLAQLLKELPGEAMAKAYSAAVLKPLFAQVGWDEKAGENSNTALLRSELIEALGRSVSDAAVIGEAKTRFEAFLQNPASLAPGIRSAVLAVVAKNADPATWEKLHQLAKATKNSMELREYYRLLGAAKDPAIAQKALDLSLSDDVPETLRPALVSAVSSENPELAFDFAVAHRAAFDALLEPTSRNQFYMRLAAGAYTQTMLDKIDRFAEANIPATARAIVVKTKAGIALTVKRRAEAAPKIAAWLASHCSEAKGRAVCRK